MKKTMQITLNVSTEQAVGLWHVFNMPMNMLTDAGKEYMRSRYGGGREEIVAMVRNVSGSVIWSQLNARLHEEGINDPGNWTPPVPLIVGEYSVDGIDSDGAVTVGCQTITFEQLKAVYDAAVKARTNDEQPEE